MSNETIFYLSILLSFVSFGLIANWYIMPLLKALTLEEALKPILILHSFRYIGLAFLVPGVVAHDLPSDFAEPAAYGDLITALLALVALGALRFRLPAAIVLVWLFNTFGILDFLYAFYQGITNQITPGKFGTMYFIPTVLVPAFLVTHFMVFALLIKRTHKVYSL